VRAVLRGAITLDDPRRLPRGDRNDPLAAHRQQFVLPMTCCILDGNSLGALPRATAAAVTRGDRAGVGRAPHPRLERCGLDGRAARVGAKIAKLIGALPHEVLCADSTSINLFKVLATALRLQADRPQVSMRERRVILSERSNFPTDLYIHAGLARLAPPTGSRAARASKPAVGRLQAQRGGEPP